MQEYDLPYGKTHLRLKLPGRLHVELISLQDAPAAPDPRQEVRRALDSPVGGPGLVELVRSNLISGRSAGLVAIAVNDKTRPVPHMHLLPPLLDRLETCDVPADSITFIIATGTHAPMTPDEFGKTLPEDILTRYRVISHNASDQDNLVYLGQTSLDTPVWLNRHYAQARLKIVVGNIEPHQFQGFSGGVKSAAIGLAGKATINHNHAWMTHPNARLGSYAENPARQDVEDIGQMIGVHFALNAVLNQKKEIVHALAGEPRAVMLAGIPLARQICQVSVDAPYDLVIASAGGYPKDINLYQSQKALAHASLITRQGGTVILVAACPEGTGSQSYETWMQGVTTVEEVFERFEREGFQIGPHKAWQIARDVARVNAFLISEMQPDFVQSLLLKPAASLEEALKFTLPSLPSRARVGIMPYANATIPVLKEPLAA